MSEVADPSPKVKKPEHIPDALVYEFDYNTDPAYKRDPHARAAELVDVAPPIFWTPYNNGHWVVSPYQAVFDAFRDYESFSSEHFSPEDFKAMMAMLPEDQRVPMPIPIAVDPPMHGKYRAPLVSTFSPKSVKALSEDIRALAEQLIDAVAPKGHCEFIHDVADIYPIEIFLKMFGLPVEREREYRELAKKHLSVIKPDIADSMNMMRSIAKVVHETILERRDNPKNDIISMLWSTEINGEPMTIDIMESYCVILFIAGLDTVVNAVGFGIRHLAENPDLQDELRTNKELIANATEELLRRYAFVAPVRMLKKDIEFHGVQLKKGEMAMLFVPGASVDPSVYSSPKEFNIHRENLAHLAFGGGPHRCLGSHLARIELNTMYETILMKLPTFRIDPDRPPTFHGSIIAGPSSLHLVWDA